MTPSATPLDQPGHGTFEDLAEVLGLAVNGEGKPEANMGIAFGDTDGDARPTW